MKNFGCSIHFLLELFGDFWNAHIFITKFHFWSYLDPFVTHYSDLKSSAPNLDEPNK